MRLQCFEQKNENKNDLRKWQLDEQERHLTLGMSTLEMAHAGREREREHLQNNIKAKHKQLKLSKTYPST
jgi:hypothetical protein